MTQPPGAQPPPGYPGNPWQTPPGEPAPPPGYPPPAPPPGSAPPYPGSAPPAYPGSAPPYPGSAPPAYPGSAPPAEQPTSGFPQPGYAPPYPGSAPPAYPGSAAPYPGGPPTTFQPAGYPPYFGPPPAAPPRRRGLLITLLVLAVVVVLGGGGLGAFYLFNRNSDGVGKSSPTAAAESFLQAVYVDQDPAKAAPLVCAAARDKKKLSAKIDQIKQQNQQYESPKYSWTPLKTESSASDHAVVSTTVTLLTANVQKATQKLRLTVIKSNGWFVCDVQQT